MDIKYNPKFYSDIEHVHVSPRFFILTKPSNAWIRQTINTGAIDVEDKTFVNYNMLSKKVKFDSVIYDTGV